MAWFLNLDIISSLSVTKFDLGSTIHSFTIERKESVKIVHTELEKYIDRWEMPELKPIDVARKVRGWVDQLKVLLKNKNKLTRQAFKSELISMSKDLYFRNIYEDMDESLLSSYDRELARCLYKKQYFLISGLYVVKMAVSKAQEKV